MCSSRSSSAPWPAFALAFALTPLVHAELRFPALISDHMVVQQGQPFTLTGWASPRQRVEVEWVGAGADHRAHTTVGADGAFAIVTDPPPASGRAWDIVVQAGDAEVRIEDVLVGEVWLCSGQSNMAWTVDGADRANEVRADADRPTIRMFTVALEASEQPADDLRGKWVVCTPETVGGFSAVAYHFGRSLSDELDTPVGLVTSAWGGSKIEAWISADALDDCPEGRQAVEEWGGWQRAMSNHSLECAQPDFDDASWPAARLPNTSAAFGFPDNADGVFWVRVQAQIPERWAGRALKLSLARIDDRDTTFFNAVEVGSTNGWDRRRIYDVPASAVHAGEAVIATRVTDTGGPAGVHGDPAELYIHPTDDPDDRISLALDARMAHPSSAKPIPTQHRPSQLYNAMVAPLLTTRFAGVTWYQGESNAIPGAIAPRYETLHTLWINNWRDKFNRPGLPFYFVQLASLAHPDDWDFPLLRNIQRRTLDALPHTGMVVTTDIGDSGDIHPRNKHDVGERLARWALAEVYGRDDVVKSGPLATLAVPVHLTMHKAILVSFETFGSRIATRDGGDSVTGVELVVDGREPIACTARIEPPGSLMAFLPDGVKLADVRAVRYGWSPDPKDANLVNEAGLPASPFEVEID